MREWQCRNGESYVPLFAYFLISIPSFPRSAVCSLFKDCLAANDRPHDLRVGDLIVRNRHDVL
jgi:hypothetical protein